MKPLTCDPTGFCVISGLLRGILGNVFENGGGGRVRRRLQPCLADVHHSEHSAWKGLRSASPLPELPSLPGAGGPPLIDLLVLPYQHIQVLHEKVCLSVEEQILVYFTYRLNTSTPVGPEGTGANC